MTRRLLLQGQGHLGETTEPELVHLLLERVGLPTDAPRVARARDPTDLLGETEEC